MLLFFACSNGSRRLSVSLSVGFFSGVGLSLNWLFLGFGFWFGGCFGVCLGATEVLSMLL